MAYEFYNIEYHLISVYLCVTLPHQIKSNNHGFRVKICWYTVACYGPRNQEHFVSMHVMLRSGFAMIDVTVSFK